MYCSEWELHALFSEGVYKPLIVPAKPADYYLLALALLPNANVVCDVTMTPLL